jgi:L-seryl-tRNA(Ser) seleniumtransferase
MDKQQLLRSLPAVGKLLHHPVIVDEFQEMPKALLTTALGAVLAELREDLNQRFDAARTDGSPGLDETQVWWEGEISVERIITRVRKWMAERFCANLRPVINLTGTIIHTNLGRAPLSERALLAVTAVAKGYSNLEFDIPAGERGSRHQHIERLLCELTGAEAAMAVNNNAAAVLLVLSTLAQGGDGIVSRGELVEIGGSFRIPDIMEQSGVRLVEVGTTNKTRIEDYLRALSEQTKVIVRVHTSNYRIVGFTEHPSLSALATAAKGHHVPLFEDLGSGALFDYQAHGVGDEPAVAASVAAGADVVSFSGDKLLGGAQAGLIVGRKVWLDQMKRHPLARVLRLDKLTLAALEATLLDHLDEDLARSNIPVVRMITESYQDVAKRAEQLLTKIARCKDLQDRLQVTLADDESTIGGGSFPGETLQTCVLKLRAKNTSAPRLAEQLRTWPVTPLVSRISHDEVVFDVRTLLPGEEAIVLKSLHEWAKHESHA